MTDTEIQAAITALKTNLARGIRSAKVNGEEVTYSSVAEMRAAIAYFEGQLAGSAGSSITVAYPKTTRGL